VHDDNEDEDFHPSSETYRWRKMTVNDEGIAELYVQQFDRSVLEVEGSLTRLHEAKSDHA